MPNNSYLNFYYDKTGDFIKYYSKPFTITALYDDVVVGIKVTNDLPVFGYSLDNGITWTNIDDIYWNHLSDTESVYYIPALEAGQQVQIIGNNTSLNSVTFSLSSTQTNKGLANVSGNIISLLDVNWASQTVEISDECFETLFYNMEIVDASNLILPTSQVLTLKYIM